MSLSNQSNRIICSILRNPSCFATASRSRTPCAWIRSITTRPAGHAPSISFGPDADAVLSKYIKKPLNRQHTPKKTQPTEDAPSSKKEAVVKEFEIEDFVDRSTPLPTTAGGETKNSSELEQRPPKKRKAKTEKPKTERTRFDGAKGKMQKKSASASQDSADSRAQEDRPEWKAHKQAMKESFADGWNPRKKLSPDAMEGIRGLHQQDPIKYSTEILATQFKVSPEAIRRILKSKWLTRAGSEVMDEKRERFAKRHDKIWDHQAELGLRPKRTKDKPVEHPDQFEHDMERRRILREI